ncbi:MAG: hypothetical protein PF487_02050 [Bacteroidales bacterium]|jgi:hypothetical protein|nr:hypothetical protein [Bacteroidales bacterium]
MKVKYIFNSRTLQYEQVKRNYNLTKVALRLVIITAIGYFIIGFAFVYWGNLKMSDYINIAAIVGGISSTAGLLSFYSSRIQKKDFENIGIEYFKDVVIAAENLEKKEKDLLEKEQQLGLKEKELQQLELKKAELELLIKKASMTIFLKEKVKNYEENILRVINNNKELTENILDREKTIQQLSELKIEIEKNNEMEKIDELIQLITKNDEKEVKNTSPFTSFLVNFIRVLIE